MTLRRFKQLAAVSLLTGMLPSPARAGGWREWWLPKTYSVHGPAIDSLFIWIFWITTITFVLVQGVMIFFLIKYRFNAKRKKAVFSHGNIRLEMIWTITPAIILLVLALFSKAVWDRYRYSPIGDDASRAKILVIGQQFKWNTIYPGPDGVFGRYLVFPKPTDTAWPDGKKHAGVNGPVFLPGEKAIKAINDYNDTLNPLGKDFEDPAGKDDIYEAALAREIVLPADRPIEVQLMSKDVIHDFFLPNFAVKLDAVPGMRGLLYFQATHTSRSMEEHKRYQLDELAKIVDTPAIQDLVIEVDPNDPNAAMEVNKTTKLTQWKYVNNAKSAIIRGGSAVTASAIDRLKSAGLTEITLYKPYVWELVCDELCGAGHSTMRGQLRFVTNDEYDSFHYDKPSTPTPALVGMGKTQ